MELARNLASVRKRIEKAATRAGRKPEEVTLVGVTKTVAREVIEEAYHLGLKDFGENRVDSAEKKFIPGIYPEGAGKLHLIGHLQTNKVRRAVELVDTIHSVDSLKLAQTISRICVETGKVMPVLVEVNVAREPSKHGFTTEELDEALAQICQLPNLEVRGLMAMAPFEADPEKTRQVFRTLRKLFESYSNSDKIPAWVDLSMGMTNDFEIAIEEGATLIRVGRAIFS